MSFISISLIVEEAFHAVVRGFRNYFLVIIGARFQPKNVVILQLCSAQDLLDQPSISQGTYTVPTSAQRAISFYWTVLLSYVVPDIQALLGASLLS